MLVPTKLGIALVHGYRTSYHTNLLRQHIEPSAFVCMFRDAIHSRLQTVWIPTSCYPRSLHSLSV